MGIKYLNDLALESVVGGLGKSINTYDPTTGLINQDLTHANEAAWGGGSGNFTLNNKGLMEGNGVKGLSTAESV